MKTINLLLAASLYLVAAHAETQPAPASTEPAAAVAASAAPAAASKMPRLEIKWGCGECTVNEKVIPLLEESYFKQVTDEGKSLAHDDVAEVVISEFKQRPPGMRVMFGAFAGKDILGVQIKYKGKDYAVEDYMANAWQGMNALCESVAQLSYKKLAEAMSPAP